MTYSCKQAIVDQLSACGDQSTGQLRRYCREQATDYGVTTYYRAINELVTSGTIWRDMDAEGVVYSNGC